VKEVGSGASQRERRETLQKAARRRKIDVVLVWRPDRWDRSVTDLLATLQELEHVGVGFVSLTEALDLTTPAGRAIAGLLAVFAEFERESESAPAWRRPARIVNAWADRSPRDSRPTRSGNCIMLASAKPRSPVARRLDALRYAGFWERRFVHEWSIPRNS